MTLKVARVDVSLSVIVPADQARYVTDWLYEGLECQLRDFLDLGAEHTITPLVEKKAKDRR